MQFYDEKESPYFETAASGSVWESAIPGTRRNDEANRHCAGQLHIRTNNICEQLPVQCGNMMQQ